MLPISRVPQAVIVLAVATMLLMTTGVSSTPTTPSPFPSYVRQAMTVAAIHTHVPILGPVWLPDTKASGSRLMPSGGTFAATVQATATQYQMEFWVEAHTLPVNSPQIVQDSGDPSDEPIVTISGQRYATKRAAAQAVTHNPGLSWMAVPPNATRLSITPTQSGWIWKDPHGSGWWYEAWAERGWLIETVPVLVGGPKTNRSTAAKEASQIARTFTTKIMSPMPGQRGTIAIAQGDGDHTTAMWQRGRIVYSVFANYGLSSATTVVGSLYPMARK